MASLKPEVGVGVDFSSEMIELARRRYPNLRFVCADAHDLYIEEEFDVIILSDLVNDLWDVQAVLEQIARLTTLRTRVIINSYSRLWEPPLAIVQKLGLGNPTLYQNWLTVEDITNLLRLADFEVIRQKAEILWPLRTPLLAILANRFLVKLWPFKFLALTNVIIAQPRPRFEPLEEEPLVSIVIPARNEAGNIPQIFERVPEMGRGTELVFVEGHSKDDAYAAIEVAMAAYPERRCRLLRQTGMGKGDAVRMGFAGPRFPTVTKR